MRVLLMADSFGTTGGGEIMVAYLARELSKRHTVAILTAGAPPTARTRWEGLELFQIHSAYNARLRPFASIANPNTIQSVRRVLTEWKPDVVHAWNIHQHLSYEALRQVHARGIPLVHTSQDAIGFCYTKFHCWIDQSAAPAREPPLKAHPEVCRNCRRAFWTFPLRNRFIRAYLSSNVGTPVAVSHALRDALQANGLPTRVVVHNGLPPDELAFSGDPAEGDPWNLGSGPVILAGGRLGHFKGHEVSLRAFHRVTSANSPAKLVMMGGESWYSAYLGDLAIELGLSDNVTFTGLVPRHQIPRILARCAMVLTLSLYLDPFPTMNLEAMAASRPVVGTCFGGTSEAVSHASTGLIVNPYDLDAVACAISGLLNNPDMGARLGVHARERLLADFTLDRMARTYEQLYLG